MYGTINLGRIYIKTVELHCVKIIHIRSYSGPHFPAFGRNTESYGVCLPIQSKCGKIRPRITPNTDTFFPVLRFLPPLFTSRKSLETNSELNSRQEASNKLIKHFGVSQKVMWHGITCIAWETRKETKKVLRLGDFRLYA